MICNNDLVNPFCGAVLLNYEFVIKLKTKTKPQVSQSKSIKERYHVASYTHFLYPYIDTYILHIYSLMCHQRCFGTHKIYY